MLIQKVGFKWFLLVAQIAFIAIESVCGKLIHGDSLNVYQGTVASVEVDGCIEDQAKYVSVCEVKPNTRLTLTVTFNLHTTVSFPNITYALLFLDTAVLNAQWRRVMVDNNGCDHVKCPLSNDKLNTFRATFEAPKQNVRVALQLYDPKTQQNKRFLGIGFMVKVLSDKKLSNGNGAKATASTISTSKAKHPNATG